MKIGIKAIEYYLPEDILTNDELAAIYDDWTAEKILNKTGIEHRHISKSNETAADLAFYAAEKLFHEQNIDRQDIDFVILLTQSPDYHLPTSACILQHRLGLSQKSGAFDINLGCSAYIYGLAVAKGLINSGIAKNVLLLTAETYSKYIHPMDKSNRTIFGDGAAATLISTGDDVAEIGAFDLGTDGSGAEYLMVPAGAARIPKSVETGVAKSDENGSVRSEENIYMSGADVFNFTIEVVPQTIKEILIKENLQQEDIDLFIFHQANKFMLDYLRKKIKIDKEKFYMNFADIGNTVSATIPIALKRAQEDGKLKSGDKVMLVGFGVGLSWGSTILNW
ncbi:3-oxoacyl-ACP synthase III family protein [Paenibacillus sp. PL91]|uniref:3-oxoacyl-ACP synthase III family protein n=1 Tax=Paenibacillus sp. PL91 TaxID=2729538 RepID=UPI00145C8E01|nr:ketoacyl-ACP synthase III [Paenibacillus sp. PL91]MBC9202863.1 ketoacyl-ACP synthase III [Paenibacillus sp. PL91]